MPKERTVPSKRTRVSPYPLRSSRTQREIKLESAIQTQGPCQWEDIRCVICLEPPHNAVLLKCSSFSNGCHTYMCDTSRRHSNCFKQYRRKNRNRFTKAISCTNCRGEVNETIKVSAARRYFNAKPRACAFDGCTFSGTYTQLEKHLKAYHPRFTKPLVDPERQRAWEEMQRADEYTEIMTAAGLTLAHHNIPPVDHMHHHQFPPHSVIQLSVNEVVRNYFFAASPLMPTRVDIQAMAIVSSWTPS
ncbi:unnamed protein product [Eruca vesicaria subsp. sativa]|uniref:C2H2-type domain-containing protein n=1 Tax=Eruca vesicaria subsp. sativa TaxID=29727 RepID=A0ABC8JVQ9_ERUVS|nr:unnamed protein product [Eruca vesicaria subsp. sativa]